MNVKSKSKKSKRNRKKQYEFYNTIVQKKNGQIEDLKREISHLEIDCKKKDELIHSIDYLLEDFKNVIKEIDLARDKYDTLCSDLMQMRKIMCKEFFGSEIRWCIIKKIMNIR